MPRERTPWYGDDDREFFEADDLRYRDRDHGPMSDEEWSRHSRRPYEAYYERRYGGGYGERPRRDPRYDLAPSSVRYASLYQNEHGVDLGRRYRPPYAYRDYGTGREQGARRTQERDFWDRAGDEVASWPGDEEAEPRRRPDQYRGRGPKGYTRSDERIKEDVCDRLSDDPSLDASEIEVEVEAHEVTLSGEVASRYDKRRAEDLAEDVSGVTHVQNNLRVRRDALPTSTPTTF